MITVEQAFGILDAAVRAGGSEEVAVADAVGRVIARDVRADVDWPPFDTSAMDGYAVRMADVAAPGANLAERQEIVAAGDPAGGPLGPGEAVRVMTGAPLPAGTEAIVPVEQAHREGGRVRLEIRPKPGAHIRKKGESVARGAALLDAGRRLTPAEVALAALAGADPLDVMAKPRVAVAVTGNELVAPSDKPSGANLRDSNGPLLLSLCRRGGWPSRALARVRDEAAEVDRLFSEARPEEFLVTSGGVSAGDHDLLPVAAERAGFEILFHKVAVRPGRPIAFGRRDGCFWFGLPGNPVSASVGFHLFVRYALDRREGSLRPGAPRLVARLAAPVRGGSRETYRDATLHDEDGENLVEPVSTAGSHDIAAHARSNALIRLPAGSGELSAGTLVECVRLDL
ncbi:MAG: gephyrin-like molybdotransferase Glp [Thermoanaerobaculia bacterium]